MQIELDDDQKAAVFRTVLLEEINFYKELLADINVADFCSLSDTKQQDTIDDVKTYEALCKVAQYYI